MTKKTSPTIARLKSKISKPQTLRVLMVEDSEDDALLMIRELKKGGYHPMYERVETTAAMKKALKEKQWDILLCDYKLPKFNAPSAIALLKKTNIDIPIIIVSGTISEETAVECMRLGAHDYIMKNNLSRLCSAIARELEEKDSRNKRKQAEKILKEAESRFRNIFESSKDGIIFFDGKTRKILFGNSAMAKLLGCSKEDLVGRSISSLHPSEEWKSVKHEFQKHISGQTSLSPGILVRRNDGSVFYADISSSLIMLEGKTYFSAFFCDITERRRMEEALRESEENFRRSMDDSSLGIRIVTAEGETLYANRAVLDMYGYEKIEELRKKPLKERYTPDSYAEFQIRKQKRERGEFAPSEYEISIVRKNGEIRHIQVFRKEVIWNGAKQFQIIYQDITKQKNAQDDLLKSEEKYRSIVENAQEGIYQSTPEGRHLTINPAFARMLGYDSPEEVMSTITDIAQQLYVNPADRENLLKLVNEKGLVTDFETEFYKKDGSRIWVSVNMHVVRDEQGKIIYYQGIDQDITERKKVEAERQENIERLRKSLGATINAMAVTVETRDPYTAGHQRRVADLARAIAVEMNLGRDRIDSVRMASMIHDIGKISIPSEILTKPTALSSLEFNLIKTHPESGYNILKDIEFPWPIARIVLEHHERINGSGYPSGLKGEQILLESKIIAIADVVEAISSNRPYRPAKGLEAALTEISKNKGILYEPDIADACLRLFHERNYNLAA